MNELIGQKFKRNKYGISTWTDIVQDISISYNYTINNKQSYFIPEINIKGSKHIYKLSEVVFVDKVTESWSKQLNSLKSS